MNKQEIKQAKNDFDSLFEDSNIETKKYPLEMVFNVIRLLQQGVSSNYLLEQEYSLELVEGCLRIKKYLFVCYKNQFKEYKRGCKQVDGSY